MMPSVRRCSMITSAAASASSVVVSTRISGDSGTS